MFNWWIGSVMFLVVVLLGYLASRWARWARKTTKLVGAAHATLGMMTDALADALESIVAAQERLGARLDRQPSTVTVLGLTSSGEWRTLGDTIDVLPGCVAEVRLRLQESLKKMVFMLHGPRDATIRSCVVGNEHLFCAIPERGVVYGVSERDARVGSDVVFVVQRERAPEPVRGGMLLGGVLSGMLAGAMFDALNKRPKKAEKEESSEQPGPVA